MYEHVPLWSLCTLNNDTLREDTSPNVTFEYVDISSVSNGVISDTLETYSFGDAPSRARRLAQVDDIIVSTVRTYLRAIAQVSDSEHFRVYSTGFVILRPLLHVVIPKYLLYVLTSAGVMGEIVASSVGVSYPAIQASKLIRIRVPCPDILSQKSIVKYLDKESADIDAMLATLDELTETLRQRRVRVIQSAVRSSSSIGIGLMLDVKLGKMLQTKPKSPTDRLQPYLRAAHIQPGGRLDLTIDTKEMYFSERESETLSLRAGDAVIVEGGSIGRTAYLTEDMPGWGFQNSIIRLRGASSDTRYAVYALQAALESGEIAIACNAATFAHFTAEKVESFRIPYHGTDEHRCIADHLDEVTGKIDAMVAKVAELKALLVERRAALITDVVTGRKKIPS